MKFNSKICALSLALAMGVGMLVGCNNNKGGNTPQPPVKYLVNATDTADYSFAGLHDDKLYVEGESVSFTVSLLNDEKLISQVGYISGTERNPLELINEAYSFEMPANNVSLFVTLRDVDRYEITYEGKLQVGGDPVVFGLKKNGAAQLTWTLTAIDGGEHVTINEHTVTPVSEGTVTFAASLQGEEVARKEVTVERSAYYTIADAIDDAWAQGGDFQDNTKSTKSEGKYKIRAKVVFMGSPYNSKVEMLLDDGTGILDYQIGNQSTAITDFAVGDVIEIEEQLQNYFGLMETYSSAVRFAKKVTGYEIETTPFTEVDDGAEFDSEFNRITANAAIHTPVPMTVQAKGKLGDKQDATKHRYEVPGATHGLLATTKSVITLAWEENALYNFKGYLLNYNDSAEYSNFIAIEQSRLAAQSVTIDQEDQELSLNNTLQLTYTTNPVGAGIQVSWESSAPAVASVDENGLVTAHEAGTAIITLTVDGHTDTITITVPAALKPATAASFDEATATVETGSTLDLDAKLTVTPADTTDAKVWSVEEGKEGVLTVSQQGVVTPVGPGSAVVTVKLNDDVSAQITVTVTVAHGKSASDPLTAAEANAKGAALANKATTPDEWYIKGLVTKNTTTTGNIWAELDDAQFVLYDFVRGTDEQMAKFEVGAEVVVKCQIYKYNSTIEHPAKTGTLVSVDNSEAKFITITGSTSVEVDDSTTLTATVYPASLGLAVQFSSSDGLIATVDADSGEVFGIAAGSVTITATYQDLSATFAMTVTPATSPTATTVTKNTLIGLSGLNSAGAAITIASNTTNGTQVPTLYIDSVVTLSVNADGNNGKIYGSGTEWRLYQTNNPAVQLTVGSGYKLVRVKFTYTIANTGVLTFGGDEVASGAVVALTGSSATFNVGNNGGATNGQVKITGIEVVYDVVSQ